MLCLKARAVVHNVVQHVAVLQRGRGARPRLGTSAIVVGRPWGKLTQLKAKVMSVLPPPPLQVAPRHVHSQFN